MVIFCNILSKTLLADGLHFWPIVVHSKFLTFLVLTTISSSVCLCGSLLVMLNITITVFYCKF